MPSRARFVRHLLAVIGAMLAVACAPLDALDAVLPHDEEARIAAIAYGPDPRHRLDLYRPAAGPRQVPIVVFLYGGSWTEGERAQYRFVGEALARRGYLAIVPDYRLHPQGRFPGFLEDTARVVAWTVAHAAAHGGDPARLFLMGHSAGAYNAVMVAADPRYLGEAGVDRRMIRGVIGLAGPYDFDPARFERTRTVFGHVRDIAQTQPIAVADSGTPPMLLLHGAGDLVIDPHHAERLAERLTALGVPVRTRLYRHAGHAGMLISLSPLSPSKPPVLADLDRFVAERTGQSASTARFDAR
ncbi:MAG: alpha/beta hydrolase [Alphaproteobacteria bacterium]